ncbi:MAG: hypothetical protein ISR69_11585 [Gammaproteobacteria bacterium]|nr:hypothetical protein [Gammaproteobacteria bacterium]
MSRYTAFKAKKVRQMKQLAPWVAGASLAVTHIAMSTNCSVTRDGRCNTCGSCAVALVALVSWAVMKKDEQGIYNSPTDKRD